MIIDCHLHLSTYTNEGLTFDQIRDRLLREMEANGVSRACIMPDSESGTAVADLDTCLEFADGERLYSLGTAHIATLGNTGVKKLDALAGAGKIVGLKLYPGFEEFYPSDPKCEPLYELCLRHDIPVVYHSGETLMQLWREDYNHPRELAKVAKSHPGLKVVIAHFSQPHLEFCRDVVLAHPNVYVDISSLAHVSVLQVCGREYIRQVLAETARKRPEAVLFGTDWPICEIGDHISLVNSLDIPEGTREMIFSGNAACLFKIGTEYDKPG